MRDLGKQQKAFNRYLALSAGSLALRVKGDTDNASILDELADEAEDEYKRERKLYDLSLYVQQWDFNAPYARRRNPREKQFVHRVSIATPPDTGWLVENIRVPFVFEFEGEQIVYATRCPREAVAVKMRWG